MDGNEIDGTHREDMGVLNKNHFSLKQVFSYNHFCNFFKRMRFYSIRRGLLNLKKRKYNIVLLLYRQIF